MNLDEIVISDLGLGDIVSRLEKLEKCCEELRGAMSPNNLKRLVENSVKEDIRRSGGSRG